MLTFFDESEPESAVSPASSLSSVRILLVVGDGLCALSLRQLLHDAGLARTDVPNDPPCAARFDDAVDAIRHEVFDAALLDLCLPDSSGMAALSALRDAAPDMAIVALSRPETHDLADLAIQSGAQDVLTTGGFDADGLRRAVRNAVMRHRLERKIAREEVRFRDFASASSDWWFWEMDASLRFSWFSPNAGMAIGRSPESMLGRSRKDLAVAAEVEGGAMWACHLDDLDQHRPFEQFEYRIEVPGFGFQWLSVSGVPIFIQGVFGGYRGTGTNITRRKLAEEALLRNERILETAINAIDEAFILFDDEERLVFCNEKYRALYAASADLLVPGAGFEHIVREGARRGQYPGAVGRIDEWVAERVAIHRAADRDLLQQLDNGRWLRIVERKTSDGHVVGFRIDVTELCRAKEAAEAASEAKSRFLATMSHEIRTPMNGILGMAQLLLSPGLSDVERMDGARTILNSGKTLLVLLNDILDLAKVEAGKLDIESVVFDPRQLLQEVRLLFAEAARGKGLQFDVEWRGAADHFRGDPYRLRQMLSNLIGNAIKFTGQGRVSVRGRELERMGETSLVEFVVEDTGIGIADEQQACLFRPFTQADSSTTRQFGGTGLGLSIVHNLARLMKGDIGIDSSPGQGACFWFRVRVGIVAPGEERRRERHPVLPMFRDGREPMVLSGRILVVEDNEINRKVIHAMLIRFGLEATFAENGRLGADLVRSDVFDLVLMDVHMPVLDGLAATREIREYERGTGGRRLPIVALTANAFEHDRVLCQEAGMDDFLSKPVDQNALLGMLSRWLIKGESGVTRPSALSVPSVEDTAPRFDPEAMMSAFGGDGELARLVVQSVIGEFPVYFEKMDQAVERGEWKEVERATHTMKSLAGQTGGMQLAARFRVANAALKGGGRIDRNTVAGLREEFLQLQALLDAWLKGAAD